MKEEDIENKLAQNWSYIEERLDWEQEVIERLEYFRSWTEATIDVVFDIVEVLFRLAAIVLITQLL